MSQCNEKSAQVSAIISLLVFTFFCKSYAWGSLFMLLYIFFCRAMSFSTGCVVQWSGKSKYLVTMTEGGHEIVVDLDAKTCACRKYDLTGIPCFHACACIHWRNWLTTFTTHIAKTCICHVTSTHLNLLTVSNIGRKLGFQVHYLLCLRFNQVGPRKWGIKGMIFQLILPNLEGKIPLSIVVIAREKGTMLEAARLRSISS